MSVIHDQQSQSVNQSELSGLKASCYLVCLAALLLSILPRRIVCFGLFLLLLLAPLCAARWLWTGEPREKGSLFLAVCGAAGVLAGASGLSCLICFCLSVLFWIAYLCQCAYGKMPLKELCHTGFFALFSNPSEYFTDVYQDWENRRMKMAAYAYTIYLLMALFIVLVQIYSSYISNTMHTSFEKGASNCDLPAGFISRRLYLRVFKGFEDRSAPCRVHPISIWSC